MGGGGGDDFKNSSQFYYVLRCILARDSKRTPTEFDGEVKHFVLLMVETVTNLTVVS